jgi:hypothetical protein
MTLAQLAAETLVEKHLRLAREKCRHKEIYSSSVLGPHGDHTTRICLDCGKSWHSTEPELKQ